MPRGLGSWDTGGTRPATLPRQLGTLMLFSGGRRSEQLGARCLPADSGRSLTGTHLLTQGLSLKPQSHFWQRREWGQTAQQTVSAQMGDSRVTRAWVQMLALPLASHVTLGKGLLCLSFSFPICKMNPATAGGCWRFQWQEHSTRSRMSGDKAVPARVERADPQ